MNPIHGGCMCGRIFYTIRTATLWCAHCHCQDCRAAHGTAFVTWFGVKADKIHIEDTDLTWYRSSPEARRGFCRNCGTTLFFQSSRWPGETHVAMGTLNSPLDREPTSHVYWDRHVSWLTLSDDLPRRGGPTGTEPL